MFTLNKNSKNAGNFVIGLRNVQRYCLGEDAGSERRSAGSVSMVDCYGGEM